ncbi:hypothetical protein ENSA7_23230 [Enhygromyxa salina]|uniref:Uncharacterized protein n=1 Tax=Enhygromyxa salina TaxID=215803 RepID=A0A2S9YS16_9BACT|nr:hypothetical protein ENSA7_23230 [Enhygromyxa salina]
MAAEFVEPSDHAEPATDEPDQAPVEAAHDQLAESDAQPDPEFAELDDVELDLEGDELDDVELDDIELE